MTVKSFLNFSIILSFNELLVNSLNSSSVKAWLFILPYFSLM